ncbi:DNA-3-methyladenine glycosylase family protein [Streptosporangium sp. NPDC000396]|uniref:DNA-3-methyladenine glycosylase family protein n=1 Tax=Streptosporangium sp. NPDC000396 TaxID=3366185 RepID=UPI0036C369D5
MITGLDLPAKTPFDFTASLRFLRRFPATAGEQEATDHVLTKALRAGGHTVVARLSALDETPGLRCELHSASPLPEEAVAAAADRLRFYLSLDDDLTDFYAIGRDDPEFSLVIDRLYGYHQVKFPSPLENLVWAILCQRVPMPVAAKAKESLAEVFGNRLDVDGVQHTAFPDLDQLLGLSADRLGELVGNTLKAQRLHAALRIWAEVDEGFLRAGPREQVEEFLLRLPGIGPWSASFILIRGLGRVEEASIDKPLLASAGRVYRRALSEPQVRSLAGRYGRWQGYWAHYLRTA